jgi:large subunit ribosomal protein L16
MFEVGGLADEIALAALRRAQYKFSIKTKIVARQGTGEAA